MDLLPEDCISARAAYTRFVRRVWRGSSPLRTRMHERICAGADPVVADRCSVRLANVKTQLLAEFVSAFPQLSLVAREGFDSWLAENVARRADPMAHPSPATRALLDHLLGLAEDGLLPSAEVESFARQWGLPPFESDPPSAKFDPLKLPRWNLCMAVSWIVWRTPEDVRDAMDEYRSNCWVWGSCHTLGEAQSEHLVTLQPSSLTLLSLAEATNTDERETSKIMSIKSAREELWEALGQGDLTATALDKDRRVVDIPKREWEHLEMASRGNGADYLVFSHNALRGAYSEVTVPRLAVRDHWRGLRGPSFSGGKEKKLGKSFSAGQLEATRQALAYLYPDGIPIGLRVKARLGAVNRRLEEQGHTSVSSSTVLRAIRT